MRDWDWQEPMDEFEQSLRSAMQRVDAPETLAASLAKAVEAEEHRHRAARARFKQNSGGWLHVLPKPRRWASGALAAALLLTAVAAGLWRRERAEQAARANQQFTAAVRVTDQALQETREQLQRAGFNLGR